MRAERYYRLEFIPPARPYPYSIFFDGIELAMFLTREAATSFVLAKGDFLGMSDTTAWVEESITAGRIVPRIPPKGFIPLAS